MAKERLKSPRARLFVALELPAQVRSAIVAWGREALSDPALRLPALDSLHITLAFLGWLPEKEIPRLAEIVEASGGPAARIELRDPAPIPPRGRPRLFALPADSPGAVSLQAGLGERLIEARLYEPEKRPFWPHVTVARVRPEGRGSKRPMRLARQPSGLPRELLRPFDGVRMTLYRSELKPQGARYIPLARIELSREGGSEVR